MTAAGLALLLGFVPLFESWQEALQAHPDRSGPVVLYISRTDCTFCKRFEEDVLGPVMRSGEYDRVVFRELVLDAVAPNADFGPLEVDQAELQESLGVIGTPTVLFLDAQGREIAARRVGYTPNDYAAYLLERSLRTAMRTTAEGGRVRE